MGTLVRLYDVVCPECVHEFITKTQDYVTCPDCNHEFHVEEEGDYLTIELELVRCGECNEDFGLKTNYTGSVVCPYCGATI